MMNALAQVLSWQDAACRGHKDPEMWFRDLRTTRERKSVAARRRQLRQVAEAKAICMDCPARIACMDYAFDHRAVGIWGGTTTAERGQVSPR